MSDDSVIKIVEIILRFHWRFWCTFKWLHGPVFLYELCFCRELLLKNVYLLELIFTAVLDTGHFLHTFSGL